MVGFFAGNRPPFNFYAGNGESDVSGLKFVLAQIWGVYVDWIKFNILAPVGGPGNLSAILG